MFGTLAVPLGCVEFRQRPADAKRAGVDVPVAFDVPEAEDALPSADAPTCTPGSVRCSASGERESCASNGATFEPAPCAENLRCVAGACIDPATQVCVPGIQRCHPDRPQQTQRCDQDGQRWVDGPQCSNPRLTCANGNCVNRCSAEAGRSNLGCEFWPTVMAHSLLDGAFSFAVVLANPQNYPVDVTLTGGALGQTRIVQLASGAVQMVELPWVYGLVQLDPEFVGCRGPNDPNCRRMARLATSAIQRRGAYRVNADSPIAAYQFNPLEYSRPGGFYSFSSDASLLFPRSALGNRYIVNTWPTQPAASEDSAGAVVSIVGVAEGSTTVNVFPSAAIRGSASISAAPAGSLFTQSVAAGDVVQLVGANGGDLSGTLIESSQPIAVFVGHDCANVPAGRASCDHLEEQLPPTTTWGTDVFVSALRDRGANNPSVIRIVAQANGTQLTFEPPSVFRETVLNLGQVLEFSTARHVRITSTQPILVAQYMNGRGPFEPLQTVAGDPSMVLEVPTQQFRDGYDFFVPATYQTNFVNVVAPFGANLTLDGQPLRGSMEALSDHVILTLPIMPGPHRLRGNGDRIGVKVYGVASDASYMYPAGMNLEPITQR